MTTLDVKQNQIVKVFTIITTVFLPPTLIATFYGMNFSVMPELSFGAGKLCLRLGAESRRDKRDYSLPNRMCAWRGSRNE